MTPRRDQNAETADLEEQRQFLLSSLRDLEREREAGEIEEADYLRLRDDYTARAAAVLREIESQSQGGPVRREASRRRVRAVGPRRARRRRGRTRSSSASGRKDPVGPGAYVAGVVVAIVVGAGIGVLAFSTDRPTQDGANATSAVGRRLAEAHQLERDGKAADALQVYDAVLQDEPENVEALTYRGWLLARANLVDQAMESLDRAVAVDPGYPDARFFRGMVLYRQRNDPKAAIPEFEAYLASNPPPGSVPSVREVLEQARRDAGG